MDMPLTRALGTLACCALASAAPAPAPAAQALAPAAPTSGAAFSAAPPRAATSRAEAQGDPAPAPRPRLGSRVPERRRDFGTGQIGTATGVQGLTPGSGMDPFAGRTSQRTERACRSEAALSEATLCRFAAIQQAFAAGDGAGARALLDLILAQPGLSPDELHLAHRYAYALAPADAAGRDQRRAALEGMLASGRMGEGERVSALRSLAAIALEEGDRPAARLRFEQVIDAAPADVRSRVNLAALHSADGREEEARALVREAIAIARAAGDPVPRHWLAFAAGN